MSINAIGGISLYEYYYQINKNKEEKKKSPTEREMIEYGLNPTDNETLNVALLKKAKQSKENSNQSEEQSVPYSQRPWADLMYQLNLEFNPEIEDDIKAIKEKLASLISEAGDDELAEEISDLERYVETLFIDFNQDHLSTDFNLNPLGAELSNISMINKANLL